MSTTMRRFQDTHLPVVVVGPDGTVGYANPAVHRMLGYSPGALIGLPLAHLTTPEAWDDLCREPLFATVPDDPESSGVRRSQGRVGRLQSQVVRTDGRVIDVAMTVEPATSDARAFVVSYEMLPPWKVKKVS